MPRERKTVTPRTIVIKLGEPPAEPYQISISNNPSHHTRRHIIDRPRNDPPNPPLHLIRTRRDRRRAQTPWTQGRPRQLRRDRSGAQAHGSAEAAGESIRKTGAFAATILIQLDWALTGSSELGLG
jgi:hypothetical protein